MLFVHAPVLLREVLRAARPRPGAVVLDCTLGGGGHAAAMLERIAPGGRLIGLDVDALELPRTDARLRSVAPDGVTFAAHHANFSDAPAILAREGIAAADIVLIDLGISTMQADDAARGFNYKGVGPLDMRMDSSRGAPASALIAATPIDGLVQMLREHADEPHADVIAAILEAHLPKTTHAAERVVRTGLAKQRADLTKAQIKASVRRTFQALRIAVNGEFAALDALLASLPGLLAPGGRVVAITFHSGEDRRVKKAFLAGKRAGIYSSIAASVTQSTKAETRANRRAAPAKLRWAVRAGRR